MPVFYFWVVGVLWVNPWIDSVFVPLVHASLTVECCWAEKRNSVLDLYPKYKFSLVCSFFSRVWLWRVKYELLQTSINALPLIYAAEISLHALSFFHPDYSGVDPGERLCAAVSTGSLSDTISRWLPQYEEDWKQTAPLCGVGWCQGQDQAPSTRIVSAAALSDKQFQFLKWGKGDKIKKNRNTICFNLHSPKKLKSYIQKGHLLKLDSNN